MDFEERNRRGVEETNGGRVERVKRRRSLVLPIGEYLLRDNFECNFLELRYGPRVHSNSRNVFNVEKFAGNRVFMSDVEGCSGAGGNCVRNESGISGRSTTRLAVVYDKIVDTEKTMCFLYTYLVNCLLRYTVITVLP